MSRAFVKDDDDGPEPTLDRPISASPNFVTPRGLELLREALARAESSGDARETRYYRERITTAQVVDPSTHVGDTIEFGAMVHAHADDGTKLDVRIVGEDEADPLHGTISWESPIAQALIDHRVHDRITVQRPAGPIHYTVDTITYD